MKKNKVHDNEIYEKFLNEALKCRHKNCRCYCHRYQFGEFCLNVSAGMHMLSKEYIKMILSLKEILKAKPRDKKVSRKYKFENKSESGDSNRW
jgi:hypothetical protein